MSTIATYTTALHRGARPTRPGIYLYATRDLDMLVEAGPRGGVRHYWRRTDRRESVSRPVSTWDRTQRDALAR